MPSIEALATPAVLAWARTSANLEPIAAARKIKVAADRIAEWESGTKPPTIAELRRAATVYNRSLGVFFLSEPPQGFETLRDFRRVGGTSAAAWSTAMHSEFRRAHSQREALLEIADLDGESPSQGWQLTATSGMNNSMLADGLRELLLDATDARRPQSSFSKYEHLNYWVGAIEALGVLVMTTEGGRVLASEMRGFSLYAEQVPVIVLNGTDAPRGRLFTLLHELAHLALETAGLCDVTSDERTTSVDRRVEARCNAIAAQILMPDSAVIAQVEVSDHAAGERWPLADLIHMARNYGSSAEAMLRRLLTLGLASPAEYAEFRASTGKREPKVRDSGKGNFYYTKARDLGKGYIRTVSSAHSRALIDSTTAATFLDVKVDQMAKLASVARGG